MRNVSTEFKAAVFSESTEEVFIALLTLSHPSFPDDIRLTSDPMEVLPTAGVRGVISRGLEYVFLPFMLTLPGQDDTGIARASIVIDNVDRQTLAAVRLADSAVKVGFEIVLSSDVDVPEMVAADFVLEKIKYDALTVSGEITVENFDLEPFPFQRFTPSNYPGIF